MKKIFTLLLVLVTVASFGQQNFGSLSFQLSFPQQEYKSIYPVTGWGGRFSAMHQFKKQPFSIGGELSYLVTGSDTRRFHVPFYGRSNFMTVRATNNIAGIFFKGRANLIPEHHNLQVFIDGTAGTNIFFSKASYEDNDSYNNDYNDDNGLTFTSKNHWTFVWGPGLGLELTVGKRKEAAILLKASWLVGSNTKYLTDPYVDGDAKVYFNERESGTTMLIAEAGVRFPID